MDLYKNKNIVIVIAILLCVLFDVYIPKEQSGASIYNYLPYIFGSVSFLIGLYLFLLAFRIYKPKFKTDEQRLKLDDTLKKFGKRWKVSSIIIILYGLYNLIWHDPDLYRLNSSIEKNKWTDRDKATLIKRCMNEAGNTAKRYPKITMDFCTCAIDKIIQSMGRKEYIDDLSMPKPKQDNKFNLIMNGCVINATRLIDSAKKQGK